MVAIPRIEYAVATMNKYNRGNCEDAYSVKQDSPQRIRLSLIDGFGANNEAVHWYSEALSQYGTTVLETFGSAEAAFPRFDSYSQFIGDNNSPKAAVMLALIIGLKVQIAWKGNVCAWIIKRKPYEQAQRLTSCHSNSAGSLKRFVGPCGYGSHQVMKTSFEESDILVFASDGVDRLNGYSLTTERMHYSAHDIVSQLVKESSRCDDATAIALTVGQVNPKVESSF